MNFVEKLGEGGYGSVSKFEIEGKYYAIKSFPKSIYFMHELDCLSKCNHPNVIKVFNYFKTKSHFGIVMELAENDLEKLKDFKFNKKEIFFQILCGLQHIMNNNIITMDFKPGNIVTFNDGRISIIDLGIAGYNSSFKEVRRGYTPYTLYYRPLESYRWFANEKSELWALGLTLYQIENKKKLFYVERNDNESRKEELYYRKFLANLLNGKPVPNNFSNINYNDYENLYDNIKFSDDDLLDNLIRKLVVIDPKKRCNIDELFDHPYFDDIDKGKFLVEKNLSTKEKLRKHQHVCERKPKEFSLVIEILGDFSKLKKYGANMDDILFAVQFTERLMHFDKNRIEEFLYFGIFLNMVYSDKFGERDINSEFFKNYKKKINSDLVIEIVKKLNGIIRKTSPYDFLEYYMSSIDFLNTNQINTIKNLCFCISLLDLESIHTSETIALNSLKYCFECFDIDCKVELEEKFIIQEEVIYDIIVKHFSFLFENKNITENNVKNLRKFI